jgi:hypothetical protein
MQSTVAHVSATSGFRSLVFFSALLMRRPPYEITVYDSTQSPLIRPYKRSQRVVLSDKGFNQTLIRGSFDLPQGERVRAP